MSDNLETRPDLIIDWQTICYKNWHKMKTDGYEPDTGVELIEFTKNMYLFLLYLTTRFNPEELIFALDSRPTWRNKFYEDWYVENAKVFQKFHPSQDGKERVMEKSYIVEFDRKTISYYWSEQAEDWVKKKLTKADKEKLNYEEYIAIGAPTEEEIHDRCSDVPGSGGEEEYQLLMHEAREEKRKVLYGELKSHMEAYKGTRKTSSWDYDTPKRGYQDGDRFVPGFYEYAEQVAHSLAGTFGAKVVQVENAEADDIVARYVKTNKSAKDLILVSVDSDLHQLLLDNMFFKFFNPNMNQEKEYVQWGAFWDLTPKKAKYDLRKKILTGDTSDNINACMFYKLKTKKGKKGEPDVTTKTLQNSCIGEKTAITMLEEMKMSEILKVVEPKSFERNRILVHLDNIPTSVVESIDSALKSATVVKDEGKTYPVKAFDKLVAQQSALFDAGKEEEAKKLGEQMQEGPAKVEEKAMEEMSPEELLAYAKELKKDKEKLQSEKDWERYPERMGGQN